MVQSNLRKFHDKTEHTNSSNKNSSETNIKHVDLSTMTGSEEEKINAMMHQSTIDYNPTKYVLFCFNRNNIF